MAPFSWPVERRRAVSVREKDAGNPDSGPMDAQHDVERLTALLVKNRLQHPDDELLCRVVVVVQQHTPHPWPLDPLVAVRVDDS